MSNEPWQALEHGPIEHLAENLWRVEGALPRMTLRRVMTVVRRDDGSLLVHSAIDLEPRAMGELEALGEPTWLVVPGGMHRLDAPKYKKRYPKMRVFAPRGSRDAIAKVIAVDGTYDEFPNDHAVRLDTFEGTGGLEGAMVVRSKDGLTLVTNDTVFNMKKKKDLLGYLFTTVLGSAPGPRVSRLAKLLLVKDRARFREELERYAAIPDLTRLIVSHEDMASGPDAAAVLRKAATYLT